MSGSIQYPLSDYGSMHEIQREQSGATFGTSRERHHGFSRRNKPNEMPRSEQKAIGTAKNTEQRDCTTHWTNTWCRDSNHAILLPSVNRFGGVAPNAARDILRPTRRLDAPPPPALSASLSEKVVLGALNTI